MSFLSDNGIILSEEDTVDGFMNTAPGDVYKSVSWLLNDTLNPRIEIRLHAITG